MGPIVLCWIPYSERSQETKHPGRWEIAAPKIPGVKMFKTNTNGHKHPRIWLIIKERDTIDDRDRTSKTSPIYCDWVQLHQYWTIRPVYVYMSYNQNSYKECMRIDKYIFTRFLDGKIGHQEETHHPTDKFRRLFLNLLSIGRRRCASAMGVIKLPSSCSSPKHRSIN